ncbi:MAG: hypothetical protein ACT4P7_18815 [Gemmatimonadaceae bacterium]
MRFLRRPLAYAASVAVAACALDNMTSALEPETGTGQVYTLVTFNGKNVPAVVLQNQSTLEIQKGALTLSADSSWTLSYVVRLSTGGGDQNSVQTSRGVYSLIGTALKLTFRGDTATRFTGTYSPTDVVLKDASVANGDVLAFRR